MKKFYIILSFVVLFILGCISTPDISSTTEHGDLEITSFKLLNESLIFLGDSFNLSYNIQSTSKNASYSVVIKLGEEIIYSEKLKGNQTITTEVYAPINGKLNLTIYAYSSDFSKFIEENLDNNEAIIPLKIYSCGKYDFASNTTKYSIISNEKLHSVKLHFDKPTYINSIGSFVRVTAPLNIDSHLIYEIVNDINGTPGNESIFNLTLQIYKVSANWEFLLLQKRNIKLEPGTYWLNFYVDDKNFLNLACYESLNSTISYTGTKNGDEIKWKQADCEPYFILSSAHLIDTGLDFENRFSIFDVNLSNSS